MAGKTHRSLDDAVTLRRFVRQLKEGIYITSSTGAILDANPALLAILGYPSLAALQAASASELYVDPELRRRELDRLARDGEVREYELELRRPDGESRTVLDTCYRVRDAARGEDLFHGILVDITPRKRLEAELRELSRRDALTGSFNRHFLDEFAARFEAGRARWGAVVVDVDHFKQYNDRFGHEAGDAVLVGVARFLLDSTRGEDAVVRLGGDEFLVLVMGRAATRTEQVAQRLRAMAGLSVRITIGWAVREGRESLERTVARADAGLLAERERARPKRGARRR